MKKTDVLVVLFILASSIFALKDLFLPGFYTSHDGPHQIVRAYYYDVLLREGQFPPRWVGGLNFGFGYPLFIFSYHMPWIIAQIFRLNGLGVIDSVKMTFLFGFALSGIFMYFFQKSLFGRIPAFVGSLLYLYAPFRFSNIFVRGAIGDATVFIFAPLLFWSFERMRRNTNALAVIVLAFVLTGLMLSHAMVAFFYIAAFSMYVLYWLFLEKKRLRLVISVFVSFCLFVFYSAFYFLPSFFERDYTKFKSAMNALVSRMDFVPFKNLIYSPWGYGTVDAVEGAMSLSIGIAQLAVLAAVLILIFFIILKKRRGLKWKHGFFFIFLMVFSVFLMTPFSAIAWKFVTEYIVIDFNWRILSLTVFSSALVSGFLVFAITQKKSLQAVIGLMILFLAFYGNRNHLKINQSLDWDVPFYLKLEKTTNSFEEYMPVTTDTSVIRENSPPFVAREQVSISDFVRTNHDYEFKASADRDSPVTLNALHYPGWVVYDNGKKLLAGSNKRGLVEFRVKKGFHRIRVAFERTPLRKFSDLLSVSSILLSMIYLLGKRIYG